MSTSSVQRRTARLLYNSGQDLFRQGLFPQALEEFNKAEELFRRLDAGGHPWGHPLENGVSGLANVLAMKGRCWRKLMQYDQAITCLETSFINDKFERKKPYRSFLEEVKKDLVFCYERELAKTDDKVLQVLLNQQADIDPSFRFPFSLTNNAIPIARLYELDPELHHDFKNFYHRARTDDAAVRRHAGKDVDQIRMKRITFSIWLVFGILWIAYSIIMIKALFTQ